MAKKGEKLSEETKRKIALANTGRKDSPERRKKISDALTGRKLSEEHIRNIGLASTGRKHSPAALKKLSQWQLGKKLSEEHKSKLSEAHMGKPGYWTGKKRPEEFRQKMRVRTTAYMKDLENRIGSKASEATREKLRGRYKGIYQASSPC